MTRKVVNSPLNLFFRGDREYIQGSLIIEEARLWLEECTTVAIVELISAELREIVCEKCVVSQTPDAMQVSPVGKVKFKSMDGSLNEVYIFRSEPAETVPRIADSQKQISNFEQFEDEANSVYTARANFVFDGDFSSFLMACIEFSKEAHVNAFPGCKDVWFSGIRSGTIQTILPKTDKAKKMTISIQYVRNLGQHSLSISKMVAGGNG